MKKSKMKILILDTAPIITLGNIQSLYLLGLPKLEIVFLDTVIEEIHSLKVDEEYKFYDFLTDFNNRTSIYPTQRGMSMSVSRWQNTSTSKRSVYDTEMGVMDWLENLDKQESLDFLSEHIIISDNSSILSVIGAYAKELVSKPLCLTTLSFIKSLQEARLI